MDDAYYQPDKIPAVDSQTLRQLSTLKPWRSFLAIALDWGIIVLCIVICEQVSYWFYPLAFVIVGTRFHALEAMLHEATHYRLHSNRKVNEVVGELAVWPLGLSVYLYRNLRHFSHHKHIGTVKDTHVYQSYQKYEHQFAIPKGTRHLLKNCLAAALSFPTQLWLGQLYTTARILPRFSKTRGILWICFQVATWIGIIAGVVLVGWKVLWIYLLFFVLPLMWVAVMSRYVRLLAEHFGIPVRHPAVVRGSETRTVLASWPVRVLLWPHKLNYHIEHHWYPSVPFYNLPALHRILQASPQAREQMHITRGVRQLIRELTAL